MGAKGVMKWHQSTKMSRPKIDLAKFVNVKARPQFWFKPGALGGHDLVGIGHSQNLG